MDYKTAGVDIAQGDKASRAAYTNAKKTFPSRQGMIGVPSVLEGGFSGALDMGDYLLVQNDDGVGTKMDIAERTGIYATLGQDLCAMVADDAICVGAETISITNTLDTPNVDPEIVESLTAGFADICREQKIVIPGGEIAELSDALNGMVWNATAVGIVAKDRFITGNTISAGDAIIGLRGRALRSNGMTLARKICEEAFGANWHTEIWQDGITYGEALLTPSKVFHALVLDTILGRYGQERPYNVKGVVHITGGGIPGNVPRVLPDGLGAYFDTLHEPHPVIRTLCEIGNVSAEEAYRTWHCGTALMIMVDPNDVEAICNALNIADKEVLAQKVGTITDNGTIRVTSTFDGRDVIF